MLEGLEISVLNLSELNVWNDRFRFDSEFVKKEYLKLEEILKNKKHKLLANTDCKILHPSEIKREYVDEENGMWFFRTQNIRPLKIEHSNDVFISKKDAKRLSKNLIKKYDVVITRTGANFGQTALYNIDNIAIGSSHTFILRNSYFNQSFLAVFFNSKFGRKLIDKGMYGGSQPEIAPYYLSHIPIPEFSNTFQKNIEKCLSESEKLIDSSKQTYTQAENLLLEEIGLQDFSPSQEAVNIKSFKDSFATSGRLDAEYYQPKYEEYENIVISQKHTIIKNEYLHIIDRSKKDKDAYNYIEIGDVNVSDGSNKSNLVLKKDLPANAKTLVKKGDILISNVRPYRGAVTIIDSDLNDLIVSGAFTVLRKNPDSIYNNQVLQVLLRTTMYKDWLLKFNVGTSYPVIKDKDVLDLVIPFIDFDKQQQIATLIEQSFSLKKQSEHLLEVAKRAVEIAIEENEAVALKYIKNKTE